MRKTFLLLILLSAAGWTNAGEGWQASVASDESGYGEVRVLGRAADNTIKDEYATKDVTPVMEFRCAAGSPEITARIDWGRFISSFSTEVGFGVDGGGYQWLKWKVDRSEKVTLSPSPEDTGRLLDWLKAGDSLAVEITPYSEAPVTATWSLEGFADALAAFRGDCG